MKRLLLISALAAVLSAPAVSRAYLADGVEAVVNDHVITFAEVKDYAQDAINALQQQYGSQPDVLQRKMTALLDDALDQLVDRQLILHSFDTDGYKMPDGVVDQLVQDRIREQFGDRVTLIKTLQARGMTFEQFRQQIRDQYISASLRNLNVQREVIISPAKIVDYYNSHQNDYKVDDQVKLRMIVLTKASPEDTNAMGLAQEIHTKLKEGASFAVMAGIYSQSSQQHQGGEEPWLERSALRKDLAEAAFSLSPGQISDVIDAPDAEYILQVEDRKPAEVRPLAEVRNDIEQTLRTQEQARLEKTWMDGLKKKTFVRYID